MQQLYGQCHGATVILHGGAGAPDPQRSNAVNKATIALRAIAQTALKSLKSGRDPLDVVVDCLKEMELDEQFNAGKGAALQADGQARLTAALMDGPKSTFSAVISTSYISHPSVIARHLQGESSRVLTSPGAELKARQLGMPIESSLTPGRVRRWEEKLAAGATFCDTVGCVVRGADGKLYAGTSTGGRGFEFPGRVSDSGTVAGTYCTPFAGVSATGVGEEIVDDALAARLETRRRDGSTLEAASRLCFEEGKVRARAYGWIALDAEGHWGVAHLTPGMPFVVVSEQEGEAAAAVKG